MSYLDEILANTKATQSRNNSMGALLQQLSSLGQNGPSDPSVTPGLAAGGTPGLADAAAVRLAKTALGTPYQWGGNSMTQGVDCSGLVQQVYSRLGIHLPRTAAEQAKSGQIVPSHQAQPGDLVSFDENPNDANGRGADHIGIYAGNGMMVVAPHTGDVVKMQPISAIGVAPVFTRVPGHPAPIPGH